MLAPELLAAMASGCWAIGALFSAMCLLWIAAIYVGRWPELTFESIAWLSVSSWIGMTLILQALKTGQANLVAIFSSIAPVVLLPLLWMVYRRKPASGAWWGGAMTVIGSAIIMSAKI